MSEATRARVIEKIAQVFPDRKADEVLACLDRYGAFASHRERDRVHLAILKLCDEEGRDDPASYVDAAVTDYRDVLAWAEYPNLFQQTHETDADLRRKLERRDRAQYLDWLHKR